jgi:hypothetical protein
MSGTGVEAGVLGLKWKASWSLVQAERLTVKGRVPAKECSGAEGRLMVDLAVTLSPWVLNNRKRKRYF